MNKEEQEPSLRFSVQEHLKPGDLVKLKDHHEGFISSFPYGSIALILSKPAIFPYVKKELFCVVLFAKTNKTGLIYCSEIEKVILGV